MTEPTYDLDYAISRLRDAIDYAEITKDPEDFVTIRKWVNEVELSSSELKDKKRDSQDYLAKILEIDKNKNEFSVIVKCPKCNNVFASPAHGIVRREDLLVESDSRLVDPPPGIKSAEGGS